METKGIITLIKEVASGKSKADKEWKKVEFLLKTDSEYNNEYCFQIFGEEKVDKFIQYNKVDDLVDVKFNVQTSEWKGRHFTTLDAWSVFKDKGEGITNDDPAFDATESDIF